MPLAELFLLLNLISTWWMVGLIWFVQIVHYPLMAIVADEKFVRYEEAHTRLTTIVVGPAMLVEVLTSIAIIYLQPNHVEDYLLWIGLGLVVLIWGTTACCSVPMHRRLEKGFDSSDHRWLVQSNWIRTAGWSTRGVLVAWFCWQAFGLNTRQLL